MNTHPPTTVNPGAAQLQAMGQQLRARRRVLRVTSTAAAEAAAMGQTDV